MKRDFANRNGRRRESRLFGAWLAVLCGLIFLESTAPRAEPAEPAPPKEKGVFSVQIENDLFGSGTDRHYTNGIRLAWSSAENDVPDWVRTAAGWVPVFAGHGKLRTSYEIGHSIYSPDNTSTAALIPDERPYAGYLYAGVGLVSDTGRRRDNLQFSLGIIGPSAFGEEVQRNWHSLINSSDPKGWDNQLKDEIALLLTYERQWWRYHDFKAAGLGVDMTPHVGFALGNVFTHAAAGLTVRIGENLESDRSSPPRIRPSLPGSDYFVNRDAFGWYLFAGFEGRLVGRNIFLDGNTFRDSHSVDKKYIVGDFQAGLAVTYGRVRVAYTYVLRTKEFRQQDAADQFGSLSLSIRF
ncbi:MAG: lipid A deacylase LpxR family protein [Rhodospirillales bacterium]